MFDNLSFAQLDVSFLVKEPIELQPYPGSAIRGCLGWALRDVSYGTNELCTTCPNRSECRYGNLYAYLFEAPADHPIIVRNARFQKYVQETYPQPLIVYPPAGGVYLKGDPFIFKLTLVGEAIEFLPFLCCGFKLMEKARISGGRNRIRFHGVQDGLEGKLDYILVHRRRPRLKRWFPRILDLGSFLRSSQRYKDIRSLTINFLTPFRFKYRNRLGKRLDFSIFIRNLLRRLSLLSIHSPLIFKIDYPGLLDKARSVRVVSSRMIEWHDWERYSSRQDKRMKLGGLVGEIRFSGNLEPFIPYIMMGEFLHVGKGGSFGLGKYVVVSWK